MSIITFNNNSIYQTLNFTVTNDGFKSNVTTYTNNFSPPSDSPGISKNLCRFFETKTNALLKILNRVEIYIIKEKVCSLLNSIPINIKVLPFDPVQELHTTHKASLLSKYSFDHLRIHPQIFQVYMMRRGDRRRRVPFPMAAEDIIRGRGRRFLNAHNIGNGMSVVGGAIVLVSAAPIHPIAKIVCQAVGGLLVLIGQLLQADCIENPDPLAAD